MSFHAYGYEGKVEEAVPVEEFHRARCEHCDWKSEEFDAMDWQGAEQAAIEHYENECIERDDDEDDEDEDGDDDGVSDMIVDGKLRIT